jgi:hypothetical protein
MVSGGQSRIRILFGYAGGVVSYGHCEPEAVAELGLEFGFPCAGTATVAAADIGKDEQLPAATVAISAANIATAPAATSRAGRRGGSCAGLLRRRDGSSGPAAAALAPGSERYAHREHQEDLSIPYVSHCGSLLARSPPAR